MRHGAASEEGRLTPAGAASAEKVLKKARELGIKVETILSSPLERAKETAEIASRVFGQKYAVMNSLEPESSPDLVIEELKDSVLLVSHRPLVSLLVKDLTGKSLETFEPATFVTVEDGRLVMFIPPSSN